MHRVLRRPQCLPEAITAIWPDATVGVCVVHLVRNSLRYASKSHWQKITGPLREADQGVEMPIAGRDCRRIPFLKRMDLCLVA